MAFTLQDYEKLVTSTPPTSFSEAPDRNSAARFVLWVTLVDAKVDTKRPLMFYGAVARHLAELVGSVVTEDYALPNIVKVIETGFVTNSTPFQGELESSEWKKIKLTPAHLAVALRV